MTTIVAVEKPTGVTIAADSRISGYQINDGWIQKIVQNGDFTFAAAGYLRAIQVLQHAHLPQPPLEATPQAIDRFVSVELVPALTEAFNSSLGPSPSGPNDDEALQGSVFLVVVRGRIYEITGGDGAWVRSQSGHYAIGSGAAFALGALEAGVEPKRAVKIASIYDPSTNSTVFSKEIA